MRYRVFSVASSGLNKSYCIAFAVRRHMKTSMNRAAVVRQPYFCSDQSGYIPFGSAAKTATLSKQGEIHMNLLQEYKCPCCGGAIEFDSTAQKMKCPYCRTEFDM